MSEVSNGDGKYSIENYKQTRKRRRDAIRRLATRNFTNKDKFLTLTFRDNEDLDIFNPVDTNIEFKNFIKRLRRKFPGVQYLAVIEFQDANDRGAVHYHALISGLPFVPVSQLQEIWGLGFVYINKITHVDNVGAYVIKYMNKDMEDFRLKGLNAYLYSKKLQKPKVLRSWVKKEQKEMIDVIQELKSSEKKAVYSEQYDSENAGHISYSQYNLMRKNDKKQSK